jgi:hypothetical protein
MSPSRAEVRAEVAAIKRHATVIGLMRRALDPAPISDDPREPLRQRPRQKKPRAVLVFPAKYARLLQACMCQRRVRAQ